MENKIMKNWKINHKFGREFGEREETLGIRGKSDTIKMELIKRIVT